MADLEDHIARLHELIQEFEALEEGPFRSRVFELLEQIDHVHRSGIWRLFQLVTELGGKGLMDRVTPDPSVKLLFILYDLIPVDPLQPLEAAAEPPAAATAGGFVPLSRIGGRRPAWQMAIARADLLPGAIRAIEIGATPVVVCSSEDAVTAFRNGCGRSTLPLHPGRLADGVIECPWHGCRFDVRTGKRLSGRGGDLEQFAVSIRDDVIYVATNVAGSIAGVAGEQR